MVRKLNKKLIHVILNIELISSLLDPRLVNPGSTLMYVGACDSKIFDSLFNS